jgi:hypothetical protein
VVSMTDPYGRILGFLDRRARILIGVNSVLRFLQCKVVGDHANVS